jgi:1-aminocyclopropane-1-carboxylate deaminase
MGDLVVPESLPLETIDLPELAQAKVSLQVLRLDQNCLQLSGNKYFKLKYNLLQARQQGCSRVMSFGGAYSNHIHALAQAGKHYGLKMIGVIRGERIEPLNPTLADAVDAGMQLHFVSRKTYARRYDGDFHQALIKQFGDAYLIPEGGNNVLGAKGCSEIIDYLPETDSYDVVALPCGTGNTLAGIAAALPKGKKALGFAVLKAAQFLNQDVAKVLSDLSKSTVDNWSIEHRFHGGGYAKCDQELARFVMEFSERFFSIEPVYTGKLFWGLMQMITAGEFAPNTRIVAIHTGGLQGLRGMQPMLDKRLKDS